MTTTQSSSGSAPPAPAHPNAAGLSSNAKLGMSLAICGFLVIPGIDAIAKHLSDSISAGQAVWSRFAFQTLFLFPIVAWQRGFRVQRIWALALRGFLIALATVLFFFALKFMPIAEAISIFFVEPMILTIIAALFLGETVGWRRVLAILVGFSGALLIIRPSYELFGWVALFPVGTAFSFACYMALSRWLVNIGSAFTMQFYAGVFGCLTMSIALAVGDSVGFEPLAIAVPTQWEWILLISLGFIATVCHTFIVFGLRYASASVIAPFQYLEIIGATALGFIFFGDFPDTQTWIGIGIIIASGLYIFHREKKVGETG